MVPNLVPGWRSGYATRVQTRWLTAAVRPDQYPAPAGAEFAFLGRSNVGKSTLLNALGGARVARTSKTPGRTQTLHFFEVQDRRGVLRFTDLPGYGYAKVPPEVARAFEQMVTAYFRSGRATALLLLLDVRRGVLDDDRAALQVARAGGRVPVWAVGTKADKLSKAARFPARARIAKELGVSVGDVWLTSAQDPEGVQALRDHLFQVSCTD